MKLLTLARDLRRRKARERQRLFAAEGVRAVEELLRSPLAIRGVLAAPQLADAPRGAALLAALRQRDAELTEVTALEFASAAETESPQGVLAIAEIPEHSLDHLALPAGARLVLLDGVQDPGNVGTIVRTAAALGAAAVLALPGTVDLWNAKVVRSAMGASFHAPAFSCTWEQLDVFLQREGVTLWGADAGGAMLESLAVPDRLALVVGNEGAGLSAEARARVAALASLPISSVIESLNVAVATGILLYQLRT
ncbi:MAG TPA: RNA methyltransferase [Gemmatimonadaceae bacterium]|nr:RNA methyltransferase [Gemmatimonadaceae bacterium]